MATQHRVLKLIAVLFIASLFLIPISASAQIRAGASFLKILPGARVKSMAWAQTAEINDIHSVFANPGAAGFIREWQWSAGYSKWIADVYNASFVLGKQIRNPLSSQTRIALGVLYQGIPEFDSSDEAVQIASANDWLFSLSIGQRIPQYSEHLGIGVNLKYFKSTLDTYSADSFIFDAGVLARTSRFSLGNSLFEHGILSAGVAFTQLGPELKFDRLGTPLPQTLRTGVSFYAGTYNGLELQFSAEYFQVKDEKDVFSLGSELTISNLFSVNLGYNFDHDLMDKFSMGATIKLDDIKSPVQAKIPDRNKALKAEIATLNEAEFMGRTYRGNMSYLPVGPEYFEFRSPANGDTIMDNHVELTWEKSRDPDLYDDVEYTLLMDQDSSKLAGLVKIHNDDPNKLNAVLDDSINILTKVDKLKTPSFSTGKLSSGHYYWTVLATDKDYHSRLIEKKNKHISKFFLPNPDIKIESIDFDYSPYITMDDYHGKLNVIIKNVGQLPAENFSFTLHDSVLSLEHVFPNDSVTAHHKMLSTLQIELLKPNQADTIQIPWHTSLLGKHKFTASCDNENKIDESDENNNTHSKVYFTIPKGQFFTDDTTSILKVNRETYDLPVVTDVCFDVNSSQVKPQYIYPSKFDPVLSILAERLSTNINLSIKLQGFVDPNSEEANVELANQRSSAVKDTLLKLGVKPQQIITLPGQVLARTRIRKNKIDAQRVYEERRYVSVSADSGQEILFKPVYHENDIVAQQKVPFKSNIKTALSTQFTRFFINQSQYKDTTAIHLADRELHIHKTSWWSPSSEAVEMLIDKQAEYQLQLTDTLGRTFKTHPQQTRLTKSVNHEKHRIILPLVFAKTDPTFNFYWTLFFNKAKQLLADENWRFKFSGHACEVGPEWINKTLSQQRINYFSRDFKSYFRKNYPDFYQDIVGRQDKSLGYGEANPFSIQITGGEEIVIGDNDNPVGRKLNRRIEIEFYKEPN